jgi:hypothetical protein
MKMIYRVIFLQIEKVNDFNRLKFFLILRQGIYGWEPGWTDVSTGAGG